MKNNLLTFRSLLIIGFTVMVLVVIYWTAAQASDHIDGPITINDPVADLTDLFAFPSPNQPGHLVLILDVYPYVSGSNHFSDRVTYSILVKRAEKAGSGLSTAFETGEETFRFDCTFEVPHERGADHWATCTTPNGPPIRTQVDDENGAVSAGVRVFAGRRADPFLFSAKWFRSVVFDGVIPPPEASNNFTRLNILSLIFEVEIEQVFGGGENALFAVSGETTTQDSENDPVRRIDRIGRPEINNTRMVGRGQQEDIRNLYNKENPFGIAPESYALFQTRLLHNIAYYDSLDGNKDWLSPWDSTLATLLLDDYLVVDVTKPFTVQSYFEIENSMLRSEPHTRCGGRVPGNNIINTLMTTMINGGHGQAVTTGIPTDGKPAQDQFPYLGKPNTGLMASITAYFARRTKS